MSKSLSLGARRAQGSKSRRRLYKAGGDVIEQLEKRTFLSANVLSYHTTQSGVNSNETLLTPGNVNVTSFQKNFSTAVDGQIYAEPLFESGLSITAGGSTSTHDVTFVATQHDSLYAIDADGGTVLWHDSFTSLSLKGAALPGATAISSVPQAAVKSTDITPEIGITSTPVIDGATQALYVVAKTEQTVPVSGSNTVSDHFVQTLFKIDTHTGNVLSSTVIGDTGLTSSGGYVYVSGPSVLGKGDGATTVNGKSTIVFNALRALQRQALTLDNGSVFIAFASHGDNGPYHGWLLSYSETSLAPTGVFNDVPNGGDAGFWESGSSVAIDEQGYLYEVSGNGTFNTAATNFGANGLPVDADYGDCVIKLKLDTTTTAANPGPNGWGISVVDFFSPYNNKSLNSSDRDLGSGGVQILPDSAGSAAHPHLMVAAGKEGAIYLIDRDNMGKFNAKTDQVVQEQTNALNGSLSTPAFFDGQLYWVSAYGDKAKTFSVKNGVLSTTPTSTSTDSFGFPGSSPTISADGTSNGVVWDVDRNTAQLRAYDADSYGTELWTSAQNSSRDALGSVTKFAVPTVANGRVYVGTLNALVVYGPPAPATTVPNAPSKLTATAASGIQVNLAWTDNSNNETGFEIDQSSDGGKTFKKIGTADVNDTTFAVNNLQVSTTYSFRVAAYNSVGTSAFSNTATATTTSSPASIDFSSGFSTGGDTLQLNGGATIANSALVITDGGKTEARTVYSKTMVDITKFTTSFDFQLTSATADGFAFVLQNQGVTAIGASGGGLGYQGITKSVAIKFDLASNSGEGLDSTGLYTNGASPTTPYTSLTGTGIDLHSGDVFTDSISYDGTTLTNTITDNSTQKSATQTYTVNLVSTLGASSAYAGFSGGTGASTAVQHVLTWTYNATPTTAPAAPTGLTAVAASGTQITLAWTDKSTNEAGFKIYRSTDNSTFTEVATVGTNVVTYNDTELLPNTQYYYKVSATNAVGDSGFTNVASETTPVPPPTPTHVIATSITATQVSLTWTNNATNDTGYKVLREASDQTEFNQIGNLPADSTSFVDNTALPGTNYDYHIQCFNAAGYSDFAGINLTTPLTAPVVTAAAASGSITLTWTADASATSYDIYRSTTPGGEGTTQYTSDVTAKTFTDTNVVAGTTYYYIVESENSLAGTSPASKEVSAKAGSTTAAGGSVSGKITTSANAGVGNVTVYLDTNNNAKLDSGELSTTTAAAGTYSFSNVPAGEYVVRQVLPSGDTQTTPAQNYGNHVTVTNGSSAVNQNFVDTVPAATGGTVSGKVTTGSGAAVANVTIYLDANNNSKLDSGELSTTTTAAGAYSFSNVPAGAYVVRQVLPSGDMQTTPAQNYGNHITVTNGSSVVNQNFVDTVPAVTGGAVSGRITTSAGAGVANVTVYLDTNNNSKLDSGELSTVTQSTGTYSFSNVPAGAYIVRQVLPSGDTQTTPAQNYGNHITVTNGGSVANQNFVDAVTSPGGTSTGGSISGTVLNTSGKAISGTIVYLDANNNGHMESTELSTVTASDGTYSFSKVPAGSYVVEQVLAQGLTQIAPANNGGDKVTVTNGSNTTKQNFTDSGTSTGTASFSGTVFNDVNGNTKQDSGDAGLAGVQVYIDYGNTLSYVAGDPTTTTDSKGNYSFKNLYGGTYLVRAVTPAGYKQLNPVNDMAQHVYLSQATALTGKSFSEQKIA